MQLQGEAGVYLAARTRTKISSQKKLSRELATPKMADFNAIDVSTLGGFLTPEEV